MADALLIDRTPLASGFVETWTLNDPASRNALSEAMVDALLAACERAAADADLRGIEPVDRRVEGSADAHRQLLLREAALLGRRLGRRVVQRMMLNTALSISCAVVMTLVLAE